MGRNGLTCFLVVPCERIEYEDMKVIAVLTAVLLLMALAGCSTDNNCQVVVRSKCVGCHSLGTLCRQPEKSDDYWQRIVAQMIRLELTVSGAERDTIVNCLADDKSFEQLCR